MANVMLDSQHEGLNKMSIRLVSGKNLTSDCLSLTLVSES